MIDTCLTENTTPCPVTTPSGVSRESAKNREKRFRKINLGRMNGSVDIYVCTCKMYIHRDSGFDIELNIYTL